MSSDERRTRTGEGSNRRRFLRGVGAASLVGVLAGCLADENGDDEPADDEETDAAFFALGDFEPTEATATRGDAVGISATVANTGDEEGTQTVALEVDGERQADEEYTLEAGENESIAFELDTGDFDAGEYTYAVVTEDDEESGTLELAALLDDPDPLLSFDDDELPTGPSTLSGTVENPYAVPVEDGDVSLDVPDDWAVDGESGTEFDEIGAEESLDVSWELSIPEEADGSYELTADVSYGARDETATVSVSHEVSVFTPMSAPFGIDCGGAHTDETVEIDGLEFGPAPDVAEAIELEGENRPLEDDEIWWPDQLSISPEPNESPGATDESRPLNDEEGFSAEPDIEGTEYDSLYWTEHWGDDELTYTFGIENGVYEVTLHTAEIWFVGEEERIYSGAVNGESLFADVDLYADYGPDTAVTFTHVVEVEDNELVVALESSEENPKVSGIEIREFDGEVTDGLAGHWSFEEGSVEGDTVADSSGNGHDGEIQGGVETGLEAPVGGAAEFDGEDGTVLIDDADQIDPPAYTVSVWARSDGTGDWSVLVGKDTSLWCGTLDDTAQPRLDPHDDFELGEDFAAETAIDDGEWHHVVYCHNPDDESTIYVDGELEASNDDVTESAPSDAPLGIASKSGDDDWFTGELADVRLYDRPLSVIETDALYQQGSD
ncbi:malectin domain-containing carbohydrate-binding protein [Halobacteria archaeon AArc-dxtr1]|nr:malectin domain-containing carbohydrate-binding protein [Halobacteria archaeon AArc-dxtr1]